MAMMNPCRATRHHRRATPEPVGFGHRGDQSAFNFLKVGAPGIAWLKIVERDARMTGQGERAPVHYHVVDARRRHFRFGLVVGGAAGFSPMRSRQLPVYLVPHRCRPANRALADRSSAVIRCRRVVPPRTPRSLATAESVGSGEASGLVIVTASFGCSPQKKDLLFLPLRYHKSVKPGAAPRGAVDLPFCPPPVGRPTAGTFVSRYRTNPRRGTARRPSCAPTP